MGRIVGLLGRHRGGWRAICTICATIAASTAALGCECDISPPPITGAYSPELIIEGVVTPGTPHGATMRVEHAWKGGVGTSVTLHFQEGSGGDCNSAPPYGEPIVIATRRDQSGRIHFNACSRVFGFDAPFRAALQAYKDKTDAMVEQAGTGGREGRLALAAYLRDMGEIHRALDLYRSLFEEDEADIDLLVPIALLEGSVHDGDPKPTLQLLRQRAPAGEEWQRKLAYTAFEAACEIDPSRKDWSNVRSGGRRCKFVNAQLENANFDGADLGGAWFKDSNLTGASFKGANLLGTSFDGTSLVGATYDCNTRYSAPWLNPMGAGMIKVEGCPTP